VELSVEVWEVCVAVELLSGVLGCWLGEVDDGELAPGVAGCCELGVVCANAQTDDNNRIAAIK
jgi:hypothetical protein